MGVTQHSANETPLLPEAALLMSLRLWSALDAHPVNVADALLTGAGRCVSMLH